MIVKSSDYLNTDHFNIISNINLPEAKKQFIQNMSSEDEKQKLLNNAVYANNQELVNIILENGTKFAQSTENDKIYYQTPKRMERITTKKTPIKVRYEVDSNSECQVFCSDDEDNADFVEENTEVVDKEMVKIMLDHGGLTLKNFSESSELLYSAVKNQDEEFTEYLVEKGARGDEKFGAYNSSTLDHAVMSGNAKIVQTLVNVKNPPYISSQMVCFAALLSNADIVKSLIEVRSEFYSLCQLPEPDNASFTPAVSEVLRIEQQKRDCPEQGKSQSTIEAFPQVNTAQQTPEKEDLSEEKVSKIEGISTYLPEETMPEIEDISTKSTSDKLLLLADDILLLADDLTDLVINPIDNILSLFGNNETVDKINEVLGL